MALLAFKASVPVAERPLSCYSSGPGLSRRLCHPWFSEPITSLSSAIWHYSLHGLVSPGDSSSILYPVGSLQAGVWAKESYLL